MSDDLQNFASSTVAVAPSPATSGTTLTLESGPPSPTPPYDLTCWPPNTQPTYLNAEIVRVLAQSGNVVTDMIRNPYQSSPQPISVGWQAAQNLTSAMLLQLQGWTPPAWWSLGSGAYSFIFAAPSAASGFGAVALMPFSDASGDYSIALGGIASNDFAVSRSDSIAYASGQVIRAAASFAFNAQASVIVSQVKTVDATPTALENESADGNCVAFIDHNHNPVFTKTVGFVASIIARRTDIPGTDSYWKAQGAVRGDGVSAYTFIGVAPTPTLICQDSGASGWTVVFSIGVSFPYSAPCIVCTVTGGAGETIVWECTLELDEVDSALA